jgi:hypothetical protein
MPLPERSRLEHVRFAEGSRRCGGGVSQLAIAWKRVLQYQAEDATVYGEVVSVNRGGLLVDVEGLRGFVPMSHVSSVRVAPPDTTRYMHGYRDVVPWCRWRLESNRAALTLVQRPANSHLAATDSRVTARAGRGMQPIENKEMLMGETLPLKMIEADEVSSHHARPWPSGVACSRPLLALCPSSSALCYPP